MAGKSMFRYADSIDKFFMLFGTLGSIGDGLQVPLMMYILKDVINAYGDKNSGLTNDMVDTFALRLLYTAIGVGLSAFVEGLCWARTAERQTSRMRMEYLKSVLRQEVSFFDTQTGSTTHEVVSLISSDASSIQVALCEKVWSESLFPNTAVYVPNIVDRNTIMESISLSRKLLITGN